MIVKGGTVWSLHFVIHILRSFLHSWGPATVHNFLAFRDQAAIEQ